MGECRCRTLPARLRQGIRGSTIHALMAGREVRAPRRHPRHHRAGGQRQDDDHSAVHGRDTGWRVRRAEIRAERLQPTSARALHRHRDGRSQHHRGEEPCDDHVRTTHQRAMGGLYRGHAARGARTASGRTRRHVGRNAVAHDAKSHLSLPPYGGIHRRTAGRGGRL